MRNRIPRAFVNFTSLVGAVIAIISLTLIVFLFLIEHTTQRPNPYVGIITFIVLPAFLNLGLLLFFVGAWRTHKRLQKGEGVSPELPRLDLNIARHRRVLIGFIAGSFLLLVASAYGSYRAYEYTESVEFCGEVCHHVMKPEYTAYKNSPHERVACAQCHIGPGADWWVRSKLSGAYQVYSSIFKKYHRPIQTPVANLRPARETCEQCHWPKHFFSEKMERKIYYQTDEKNTPTELQMAIKVGGGDPEQGVSDGIHWHMYLKNTISYIATDRQRNVIPYVESRGPDGKVTVYHSTDNRLSDEQVRKGNKRTVDCIECHNRPAHQYHPAAVSVNSSMTAGKIDPRLPEIKRLAVETLEKEYKTEKEALAAIRSSVTDFYKDKPGIATTDSATVENAIKELQRIFARNYFPEMRTNWKAFPDHLQHMYSPGCMRCHDGKHKSEDGKVISNDCNSCHTFLAQTVQGKTFSDVKGLEFRHPTDIGDAWKTMNCNECHNPPAQ